MSKSLGNFYTPRDLILMGHKPSSLRYLLSSVPYRKQLNFTFDGLKQAANAVERLRNFKLRLESSQWTEGSNPEIAKMALTATNGVRASMEDDLNTAAALGAIFDLVRDANAAADSGKVYKTDVPELLAVLKGFEELFPVLADDDAEKVRRTLEWARANGREKDIAPAAEELAKSAGMSDAQVDALVREHTEARKTKNFSRSDAVRNELAAAGIILENTKDGVRWRRK
jgi:cysteinyl-tRNA synthetase